MVLRKGSRNNWEQFQSSTSASLALKEEGCGDVGAVAG